jgi:hypothetical protein
MTLTSYTVSHGAAQEINTSACLSETGSADRILWFFDKTCIQML